MTTKLTLSLNKQTIEKAKDYAKSQNISLSSLVENYLNSLTKKENKTAKVSPLVESLTGVIPREKEQTELVPNVKKLAGSVKPPKNFDYKKELGDALAEKYLGR